MGGGISSLSMAAVIGPPTLADADVDYTLAQVAVERPVVDLGAAIFRWQLQAELARLGHRPDQLGWHTPVALGLRARRRESWQQGPGDFDPVGRRAGGSHTFPAILDLCLLRP